jgi:hypothetical protein
MALKNWRKIGSEGFGGGKQILFKDRRQFPVNHLVIVRPNTKIAKGFRWSIEDNRDMSSLKLAKTRSGALSIAKKYMRSH